MGKKYCTYHLEVNYINGDKETLKIDGIHEKGNKKEAIDFYRREKDKYINDEKVKTIEFIGTTPEGKTWVQFTKEINVKKEEITENPIQENTVNLVANIKEQLEIIKAKMVSHKCILPVLDKRLNVLNHRLENIIDLRLTEEELKAEKLQVVDEIIEATSLRRWHKKELETIEKLIGSDINGQELNLTHLINIFSYVSDKGCNNKKYKYLTWGRAKSLKIYDETPYSTDEEAERIKANLKKDYSNVVINKFDKTVVGYNNANGRQKVV